MITAPLVSSSSSSSSLISSSSMTTMTTTTPLRPKEQQVRTLIPVTTSDGSKLFVSGPCIVLKTHTPAPTVAQQMQALRPLLKADSNSNVNAYNDTKNNDRNNNASPSEDVTAQSDAENQPEPLRCKRRIDFSTLGLPRPQPAAMARRNERERNRVKQVNMGFDTLRQHVPKGRKNKKLSKVDTLKEAVKYIKYLHDMLQQADEDDDSSLTATLTDTITIVSPQPSSTTISTSSSSSSGFPCDMEITPTTQTCSSTNTAVLPTADDLQLDPSTVLGSSPMIGSSPTLDCTCDPSLGVELTHTTLKLEPVTNPLDNLPTLAEQLSNDPRVDTDPGSGSPTHLLKLAPAHPNFLFRKSSPRSDSDTSAITITPTSAGLSSLPPPSSTAAPSIFTLTDFSSSSTPSPDYLAQADHSANASHGDYTRHGDYPTHRDYPPFSTYHTHLTDLPQSELRATRLDQGCRGSEGSCPVSPSESGCPEDCLGVTEGETWQDLSSDIAEWLCSKIDIDDPDVFV